MNMKIFTDNIDANCKAQLDQLTKLPIFSESKIRIMPDCHAGKGAVIGFTSTYDDKVIPNIVGVDIGCSISAYKYKKYKELNLPEFDSYVKTHIPAGMKVHDHKTYNGKLEFLTCFNKLKNIDRIYDGVGTLGGGNHFIELDVGDDPDYFYVVVHTGSRNLGKQVADYHQHIAWLLFHNSRNEPDDLKLLLEPILNEYKSRPDWSRENIKLREELGAKLDAIRAEYRSRPGFPPDGMEWLEGIYCQNYLNDMDVCIDYSKSNHLNIQFELMDYICDNGYGKCVESYTSMHNYIDTDTRIIRKGATDASGGKPCIIPMNMRDGTLICRGKGNPDWNFSAPHGAGRIMSRSQAFKELSLDDFKSSMQGIYSSTVVQDTIDEAPMVYKPAEEIKALIKDTVEIEDVIKPIYNFKAAESQPKWK